MGNNNMDNNNMDKSFGFLNLPLLRARETQCCSIDSSKRASSVSFRVSGPYSAQKREVFQIKVFSFIQNQHRFHGLTI